LYACTNFPLGIDNKRILPEVSEKPWNMLPIALACCRQVRLYQPNQLEMNKETVLVYFVKINLNG